MHYHEIQSLLNPSVYPEETSSVRLLQTHVSWLFVTDRFVYKVKKPVNLGFLDFTTLERRRFFCGEELRLNRRLAPEVYLDAVPVRSTENGASFRGEGTVIDYAVKMVRLPEELMMNRLLERGKVSLSQVKELARLIGRFHRAAAAGPGVSEYGRPEAVEANWEDTYRVIAPFVGHTVAWSDLELVRKWSGEFFRMNRDLFAQRMREGFIREGDGDLHTENICLTAPPTVFDCIEFDERYRCADTAADIAFLLMDLEYYRSGRLARSFLDEYCTVTGDEGVRDLVTFYEVYRALVRGEVESLKQADPGLTGEERERATESARRHFRLARGLILRTRIPLTLFITCGLMGSGKSSLAAELSFQLGFEVVSSDLTRKELAGMSPTERHHGGYCSGIYTDRFTRATYDRLRALAGRELAAGRSVIVDASFRDPRERAEFGELAVEAGARLVILVVTCPDDLLLERLATREESADAISDGRRELLPLQKREFSPPSPGEGVVIPIDTTDSLVHNVDALLSLLGVLPCCPA